MSASRAAGIYIEEVRAAGWYDPEAILRSFPAGRIANRIKHEVHGSNRFRAESNEPSGKLRGTADGTQAAASLIRYAAASALSATTAQQSEEVGCDAKTPCAASCSWQ
jgi:hypothetical protein